ncbi:MAG: M23 family metallopeptidase [Halioglobus sp.]|nr:M23 family metallopeptidase [Halioglobus sp.]
MLRTITATEIVESGVALSGRRRLEPGIPSAFDGDTILEPNESMVIFVELTFATESEIPEAVVHHFSGAAATNPGSTSPSPVAYLMVPLALDAAALPLAGSPVEGNGWVAINGCCAPFHVHRSSLQTISGRLRVAQRFAIDWMKIGDNGKLFDGDPSEVTSWHNYGEPVMAVANGTVVQVLDELDDQPPGTLPDPLTITIDTVDGNHVILDIGGGVYVFYAHLRRGSIRVKEGDTVQMGEVIAELGNSGNTSAPHLHLHFMDSPSALAADGIPFQFLGFQTTGRIDMDQWMSADESLDVVWDLLPPYEGTPAGHFMPLDMDVGTFSR